MKLITAYMVFASMCLYGCATNPDSQPDNSPNSINDELDSPGEQPVTTLNEAAVLKIATQAVRDNDTWADRAEYTATKSGNEWTVLVWRLPKVPGGHRHITITEPGKVIEYGRGL